MDSIKGEAAPPRLPRRRARSLSDRRWGGCFATRWRRLSALERQGGVAERDVSRRRLSAGFAQIASCGTHPRGAGRGAVRRGFRGFFGTVTQSLRLAEPQWAGGVAAGGSLSAAVSGGRYLLPLRPGNAGVPQRHDRLGGLHRASPRCSTSTSCAGEPCWWEKRAGPSRRT